MGRNAGGVRGGTLGKGATEKGYTEKMMKNIVGYEDTIANKDIEWARVFTADGDIITTKSGSKDQLDLGESPENSIVTHNHPTEKGEEKAKLTFSGLDLQYAVYYNVKEIRAVSKNYVFSMKRPKNGWGEKAQNDFIEDTYDKFFNNLRNKDAKKERALRARGKRKAADKLAEKLENTLLDRVVKKTANYYGWIYTSKKR